MKKSPLIGISIAIACVIVLASLTNVIGYQTVQSSKQKIINEEKDQKGLLFQTILDISNSKEIRRVILKSMINRGDFLNPYVKFSAFNTPVLTKNQLKQMYLIGWMLSKIISKSRMHSMIEHYQVSNPGLQKEITALIEKNAILNTEITKLSNSECNCESENTTLWHFPVICLFLYPLFIFSVGLFMIFDIYLPYITMGIIGSVLNCFWIY